MCGRKIQNLGSRDERDAIYHSRHLAERWPRDYVCLDIPIFSETKTTSAAALAAVAKTLDVAAFASTVALTHTITTLT
jgi:hypothetical protein